MNLNSQDLWSCSSSWGVRGPFCRGYIQWLRSTFSNEPSKLGRFSGMFSLAMVGLILCVFSAIKHTRDSRYGEEEDVAVPEAFERNRTWFADSEPTGESEKATIKIGS